MSSAKVPHKNKSKKTSRKKNDNSKKVRDKKHTQKCEACGFDVSADAQAMCRLRCPRCGSQPEC